MELTELLLFVGRLWFLVSCVALAVLVALYVAEIHTPLSTGQKDSATSSPGVPRF